MRMCGCDGERCKAFTNVLAGKVAQWLAELTLFPEQLIDVDGKARAKSLDSGAGRIHVLSFRSSAVFFAIGDRKMLNGAGTAD